MRSHDEYVPGTAAEPDGGAEDGGAGTDEGTVRAACEGDREALAAHETAECAGEALRERYDQEEDGGS